MFSNGKTRMIGLPYAEQSMMICKAVLIQYQNVPDRCMGTQTVWYGIEEFNVPLDTLFIGHFGDNFTDQMTRPMDG